MNDDKTNKPELIEDEDLEQASGGLTPNALKIQPTSLKIQPGEYKISPGSVQQKVNPGSIAGGDGSV